jgi:peptidoglycan/LPS O-acetylase OafA/YrhL
VAVSHLTLTFSLSPALQNELSPAGYWVVGTLAHLYLLFPLLRFAARRHLGAFVGLTLLISLATRTWAFAPNSPLAGNPGWADVLQASALGHLAEFSAGIAVGHLAMRWLRQDRPLARGLLLSAAGVAACVAYCYLAFLARGGGLIPTYPAAGILYGTALFFIVVSGLFVSRILSWRPLRAIGAISYSMYLYNFFPFVLFSGRLRWLPAQSAAYWALAFATVAALGALSHAITERPFLGRRRRVQARPDRPVGPQALQHGGQGPSQGP